MIKELKLLIKEAKKVDVSDKKHITKALQKRLGAIKGGRISVITSRLKRQREK
jgi:ribosomal protein L18E